MLTLVIPDHEFFDEKNMKFVTVKGQTLRLEHSLVSISKWESKWKKSFLASGELTPEETKDYIRFMTITQNVNPLIYDLITNEQIQKVRDYISDPMTATWFTKKEGKAGNRAIITNEIVYYYMTAFQIPFDPCEKWHFNRLMTLIKVCDEKNAPQKKMSARDAAAQRRNLNAARRARSHSRG